MSDTPTEERRLEKFDEMDAMVVIVACIEDISEEKASAVINDWMRTGTAEELVVFHSHLADLKKSLAMRWIPDSIRREALQQAVLAIKKRKQKEVQRSASGGETGVLMLRIARFIFPNRKVEKIFHPLVADYRMELDEARAESRWKMILVKATYWYAFCKSCGLDTIMDVLHKIMKLAGY